MAAEHEFTGSRLHGAASGSGSSGEMHLDYMTVTSDSGLFGGFFFFFFGSARFQSKAHMKPVIFKCRS